MILVTGGTGYIGSHTVVELIKSNYEVVIVDNLSTSDKSVIDVIETITGARVPLEIIDVTDLTALLTIADKYKVDAVVHFAAHKAVKESVENPLKYYNNNLRGMINVLYLMEKLECTKLIFSSSCTVYGDVQKVPVDETFPVQKPFSPYGKTKKVCEEMIEDVVAVGKLECISLRYFNPIGAHTTLLLGDNPKNMDNIMPLILKVAKGEIAQLTVYGDDYETKDGTCIRDYVHVMDIAAAHVCALERMIAKQMDKKLEFYNLGSEAGYSVFELIHTFEKVNAIKVNYQIAGRRKGDITQIYSDSTLAKNKLNWTPKYSLDDMISSAWERDIKYVK